MGTRFARVHAHQHARLLAGSIRVALQIAAEAAPDPVKCLVIERIFTWYPADTVCTEQLFRHSKRTTRSAVAPSAISKERNSLACERYSAFGRGDPLVTNTTRNCGGVISTTSVP